VTIDDLGAAGGPDRQNPQPEDLTGRISRMLKEDLIRLRYKYVPDHIVGELLAKRWMDNAIPFAALIIAIVIFGSLVPGFFSWGNLADYSRQFAELGLVVLALAIVMLSGGIDLSVGSTFALGVLLSIIGMNALDWGFGLTLVAVIGLGVVLGAINGVLIGYLRLRAFLTTLVTLITFRSIYDLVYPNFSTAIATGMPDSPMWDLLGYGDLFGIPASFYVIVVVAAAWHIVLSRMRPGWRLTAVGGARRSAHNAGINVRRTVCITYIWSGVLCTLAGFLNAARLSTAGTDVGIGLEIAALTAVVLGGNSLGGGRGSVAKAVIGTIIVLILTNGLISLSVPGPVNSLVLGSVLISAVFVDVRWMKNRHKLLNKVYVSPTYYKLPQAQSTKPGSGSPYALNDKLKDVGAIGLGRSTPPRTRSSTSTTTSISAAGTATSSAISAPTTHAPREVYAHVGGMPLGLAIDKAGDLNCCIGGDGPLQDRARDARGGEALRRDQPLLVLRHRRLAPAPGRRPRHRAGRPHLLQRGDHPLRHARMDGRCAGDPRQRPHHLLRPARRHDADRRLGHSLSRTASAWRMTASRCSSPTWSCTIERYWLDGPKKGQHRSADRRRAGLSRQHQPRLGRHLLAGASSACARRRFDLALRKPGLPPAHGAATGAGRVAVPADEHRLRRQVRRERRRCWTACGTGAASTTR
jgi:ribose transport system permease protein